MGERNMTKTERFDLEEQHRWVQGLANKHWLLKGACKGISQAEFYPGIGFFDGAATVCHEAAEWLDGNAITLDCELKTIEAKEPAEKEAPTDESR